MRRGGGLQNGRGEPSEVLPLPKSWGEEGGAEQVLPMLKGGGGHKKF